MGEGIALSAAFLCTSIPESCILDLHAPQAAIAVSTEMPGSKQVLSSIMQTDPIDQGKPMSERHSEQTKLMNKTQLCKCKLVHSEQAAILYLQPDFIMTSICKMCDNVALSSDLAKN